MISVYSASVLSLALMSIFRPFITLILLAATLLGCKGSGDKTSAVEPSQSPPAIEDVDAPSIETRIQSFSEILGAWDIIRFDEYEPTRLSSDGRNHAYVGFSNGQVNFGIECNHAGMPAKLTSAGVLKNLSPYDGIVSTEMGCPAEIQTRERTLIDFFDNRPVVTRLNETQLKLSTQHHVLVIQKKDTSPSRLNGIWQLRYVHGVNVSYTVLPTPDSPRFDYLMFTVKPESAGVIGFNGCNQIGSSMSFDKKIMSFGTWMSQLVDCSGGMAQLESHYTKALSNRAVYDVDGNHLTITANKTAYNFIRIDERPKRPSVLDIEAHAPPPISHPKHGINGNPLTRRTEGGDEHFFLGDWGMWQFADKPDPAFSELGPDYLAGYKPFVKFTPRREMWGQHDGVFFHRLYEFDNVSVTFTPNPRRRSGAQSDMSTKIGNMETYPQEQFMGRFEMKDDDGILTLNQGETIIRLEPYVKPKPLPPLPDDQALCEIRDVRPGESFPDYPRAELPDYGYTVMGSDETLMWDHQGGNQGVVELADGKDVIFENASGIQILRRLSPYSTSAMFSPRGLYCMHYDPEGSRHWPYFLVEETKDLPPTIDLAVTNIIGQTEYCVSIKPANGEAYAPVFTSKSIAGYDDFGFYLKDNNGIKKRIGDEIVSRKSGAIIDPQAVNVDTLFPNNCRAPLRTYVR